MQLLDGKFLSAQIKQEIAAEVAQIREQGGKIPHLVAILVGSNGASETYVASKMKNCEEVDVCALGRSGAYVIQFSSGVLLWDLEGQYIGLERRIEEAVGPGKKKFAVSSSDGA